MPPTRQLYEWFASTLQALQNCIANGNTVWIDKHEETLEALKRFLPSGSGIDSGMSFNENESHKNYLVFGLDFHHMDEMGVYDRWTTHKVTVRPSLVHGIDIRIHGSDKNGIKEYLYDVLYYVFRMKLEADVGDHAKFTEVKED